MFSVFKTFGHAAVQTRLPVVRLFHQTKKPLA